MAIPRLEGKRAAKCPGLRGRFVFGGIRHLIPFNRGIATTSVRTGLAMTAFFQTTICLYSRILRSIGIPASCARRNAGRGRECSDTHTYSWRNKNWKKRVHGLRVPAAMNYFFFFRETSAAVPPPSTATAARIPTISPVLDFSAGSGTGSVAGASVSRGSVSTGGASAAGSS